MCDWNAVHVQRADKIFLEVTVPELHPSSIYRGINNASSLAESAKHFDCYGNVIAAAQRKTMSLRQEFQPGIHRFCCCYKA